MPTDGWLPYPVTRRWVPDAFLGPVGSLLRAMKDGGEPESGARDNLETLRLVDALYRSPGRPDESSIWSRMARSPDAG